MHVIICMHVIQLIQHTHQDKDKKQVQLGLNMYFGKLMHMTTNTYLNTKMDSMHQFVSSSTIPRNTMSMLANELDKGAEPMHQLQRR